MPSRKNRNETVLRPVHPNAGIEADYRRRLNALIEAMHKDVLAEIEATYRASEPRIAADETPADKLRRAVRRMAKKWLGRFDKASEKLADYFAQSVDKRSSAALRRILKDGGISVEFKLTPAMRDIVDATVNQNVALIKSIPAQYLEQVEGMVMRSVQIGRDLGQLSKDLQERLGVTKRRAALIARTQNNMASASMARARQIEVGITEAVWVHSAGGHAPRHSHVAAGRDKVKFDLAKGWYDPDEQRHILPGELINCRCVSRPVLSGFS
jgi:uncharacterized protein with gpF-like domain